MDLNIKVNGSSIYTSVYDKRDEVGFPIVNFPWLSGDVPRLPSYGIYISKFFRFARCCSISDFQKLLIQGYRYHKLQKTFGKFSGSYSELLLHKRPYKSRFVSNSSHCSATVLSRHVASALAAVGDRVVKYSGAAFGNSNVNYFWSIKNSSEVIEKLRLRNFRGSHASSFDFSTLYT